MIINRVWGMPNKFTFLVKPIKEIVERYVGSGIGWVDPFCGIIKMCHQNNFPDFSDHSFRAFAF